MSTSLPVLQFSSWIFTCKLILVNTYDLKIYLSMWRWIVSMNLSSNSNWIYQREFLLCQLLSDCLKKRMVNFKILCLLIISTFSWGQKRCAYFGKCAHFGKCAYFGKMWLFWEVKDFFDFRNVSSISNGFFDQKTSKTVLHKLLCNLRNFSKIIKNES